MQGTQYATKRSILCRGAFCGPTKPTPPAPMAWAVVLLCKKMCVDSVFCSGALGVLSSLAIILLRKRKAGCLTLNVL